jgi:hypothetical protein
LHQSLEEFSFWRELGTSLPDEYYMKADTALIDVLCRCSRLRKVSLNGDTLRTVNLEELLPYGYLFHELEFKSGGRTVANTRAISKLLVNCSNLRKLIYEGSLGDEQDSPVLTAFHRCPLLEELDLSSFSSNQQEPIPGASTGAGAGTRISTLINRNCRHLCKLSLQVCKLPASVLRSIAGMEALKELDLFNCDGITDAGIAVLATMKLVKLRIVDFERHNWA